MSDTQCTIPGEELLGKRVLVVEDAWHVAKALKAVLEETGLIVVGPAASVPQAEALLAKTPLDVAIVDVNLNGEFSYALIDRLEAMGVPTIIVTGYAQLSERAKSAAATLQKPFSGPALLAKVREVVSEDHD